jgi:uncharacterized protein
MSEGTAWDIAMMKYLLVVAVVVGVLWLLAVQRRRQRMRDDRPGPAPRPGAVPPGDGAPASPPAAMVACAHCGVHLPRPDALERDALSYCSAEHRAAGPGRTR